MTTQAAQRAMELETDLLILRSAIHPGSTVYTILRHVSKSGMQRRIDLVVIGEDKKPWQISYLAARVMGRKVHRDGGIVINGCGMDMGYSLVYDLSRTLFQEKGFYCIGEDRRCPSNDHTNERMRLAGTSYSPDRVHSDAGYALNHKWL